MKNLLDEVKRLQKIAGILKESINEAPNKSPEDKKNAAEEVAKKVKKVLDKLSLPADAVHVDTTSELNNNEVQVVVSDYDKYYDKVADSINIARRKGAFPIDGIDVEVLHPKAYQLSYEMGTKYTSEEEDNVNYDDKQIVARKKAANQVADAVRKIFSDLPKDVVFVDTVKGLDRNEVYIVFDEKWIQENVTAFNKLLQKYGIVLKSGALEFGGLKPHIMYSTTYQAIIDDENYDDEDDEDYDDEDYDDDSDDDFADKAQKALSPNPEPPVWKSVLAADKNTLALIDKKIKELYSGAKKLSNPGNTIWGGLDKEAETTIPIALYSWKDPDRPTKIKGDPETKLPENPEEDQKFYNKYKKRDRLPLWVTNISVQKDVKSGDIAYWEILVNGETNDPYGEPTGYLTGKYAKDSTFNVATKAGLPKGTPGAFNSDNKYGDRTNE